MRASANWLLIVLLGLAPTLVRRQSLDSGLAAEPDARPEARGLIEEGIASMQRKSMGFHPLVASGREVLAASP